MKTMTAKSKVSICWVALAASILFLAIGVDYMPILACWLPLVVVLFFALRYKPFVDSFARFTNSIIPE